MARLFPVNCSRFDKCTIRGGRVDGGLRPEQDEGAPEGRSAPISRSTYGFCQGDARRLELLQYRGSRHHDESISHRCSRDLVARSVERRREIPAGPLGCCPSQHARTRGLEFLPGLPACVIKPRAVVDCSLRFFCWVRRSGSANCVWRAVTRRTRTRFNGSCADWVGQRPTCARLAC